MEEPTITAPRSALQRILGGLAIIALLLIITVATIWYMAGDWIEPRGLHSPTNLIRSLFNLPPVLSGRDDFQEVIDPPPGWCSHDPVREPLPDTRSHFNQGGTSVYAWPSSGGVWAHHDCYGVELDFLGLSRFEPSFTDRDTDPEKENNFSKRLEWIGGTYIENKYAFRRGQWQGMGRLRPLRPWYGWPGAVPDDGVWVLWPESATEDAEQGYRRIHNAYTMQERCEAIEMLGGKFYQKWEEVEVPPWSRDPGYLEEEELLRILEAEMYQ